MELKQHIADFVSTLLSTQHFIIDIKIQTAKRNNKLLIILDGDEGVDIDTCATISRQLSQWLDEQNLIDSSYTLEISSPGVEMPLQNIRQYKQHLNRKVRLKTQDGKEIKGIFKTFDQQTTLGIAPLIDAKVKNPKKPPKPKVDEQNIIHINTSDIQSFEILLHF